MQQPHLGKTCRLAPLLSTHFRVNPQSKIGALFCLIYFSKANIVPNPMLLKSKNFIFECIIPHMEELQNRVGSYLMSKITVSSKGLIYCHIENCWQHKGYPLPILMYYIRSINVLNKELMKIANLFLESTAIESGCKNNKWLKRTDLKIWITHPKL